MFLVGVRGLFLRRPAPVACGLNCIRSNVARLCCNASCGPVVEYCVVNMSSVVGQARVYVIVKKQREAPVQDDMM